MLRPKIGLDWDDVTAPFNSIAIAMANEKYHIDPPLRLEEIDTWENRGRTGIIREFYEDEELYARQQVPEKNKKAVYRLMEIADVYFITAVAPAFMGIRAKQILTAFPEFPPENIILGNAKNLVQFDIILDDAIHNVLETPATYPVLMRKPWNWKMTGLLSANQMSEFVSLVRQIIDASHDARWPMKNRSVLALVGPSGSGKDALTKQITSGGPLRQSENLLHQESRQASLSDKRTVCTAGFLSNAPCTAGCIPANKGDVFQAVLDDGQHARRVPRIRVGAIAMKRHFPTAII